MTMRELIGSASLSYIQEALYEMDAAEESVSPMIDLQSVQDLIVAFWGMTDDLILDDRVRNLLKVGRSVERIDLYSRMNKDIELIARETEHLQSRIGKSGIGYVRDRMSRIIGLTHMDRKADFDDYQMIVENIEKLI